MKNIDDKSLQQQYIQGTTPKNLEGFYKGTLEQFTPGTLLECVGFLITRFWIPWYGKNFNNSKGFNIISTYLLLPINLLFGSNPILKKYSNKIEAFPFKTKITQGLRDKVRVLQLDYDVAENPLFIRKIVDELVCIGKDTYLGKAFVKDNGKLRLVAFFKLKK